MIDTVRILLHSTRSAHLLDVLRTGCLPNPWTAKTIQPHFPDQANHSSEASIDLKHPSGIKVHGNSDRVTAETSLPKLLLGNNGRLIKNDEELQSAIAMLESEINTLLGFKARYHFTRVDPVWQFPGDPWRFFVAHRHVRHRDIVPEPLVYRQHWGIIWRGADLIVRLYDKNKELNNARGNVIRLEFSLSGQKLRRQLNGANRVTDLNFQQCYQTFRDLAIKLCPSPTPVPRGQKYDIEDIIAMSMLEEWEHNGISFFDLWTTGKSPEYINHLRSKVRNRLPAYSRINWHELLPEDGPPEPVEVEACRR